MKRKAVLALVALTVGVTAFAVAQQTMPWIKFVEMKNSTHICYVGEAPNAVLDSTRAEPLLFTNPTTGERRLVQPRESWKYPRKEGVRNPESTTGAGCCSGTVCKQPPGCIWFEGGKPVGDTMVFTYTKRMPQ